MIPTTEAEMTDLFRSAIVNMTPRLIYQGGESWKPYDRHVSAPSCTRRFRLIWRAANYFESGIFTPQVVETEAELSVRTDYAGQHERLNHIVIDDYHQLHETLGRLKAPNTGVMWVRALEPRFFYNDEEDDVFQVDHTYVVRYLRDRR